MTNLKGGRLVFVVKALEHQTKNYKQQDVFKQYRFSPLASPNLSVSAPSSVLESSSEDFVHDSAQIFYHLFKKDELERLISMACPHPLFLLQGFLSKENAWFVVVTQDPNSPKQLQPRFGE